MRIGLSTSVITGHNIKDGIANYTQSLKDALEQQQDVTIVTHNARFDSCDRSSFFTSLLFSLALSVPFKGNASLLEQLDIYHSTNYYIPKLKGIPVIATLHDAVPLQYPAWVNKRWRYLKNSMMKKTATWLTHVVTLTHAVVPDIVEYWQIPPEKISVVHPGVAPFWFKPISLQQQQAVLAKYQINFKYFLFVGTFQPRKNIERLLTAYELLPAEVKKTYKLLLVGKNGWNTDDLLTQLANFIDKGNGLWLQSVSQQDLLALYQAAFGFVFPSLYEGFGLPVLEAFASGVPVITSNTTALPEVAGDAALLVDPLATDEIAAAMCQLVEKDDLRQMLINRGKVRAKQMSWKSCAENMISVYKKVLS